MLFIWLKFIVSSLVIVVVGLKLSKYGDAIAEKTGLERGWIGVILLALVTSLPEVVTSVGAVVNEKSPDLAMGNLFGSNLFNLAILIVVDFMYGAGPVLSFVRPGNILTAALGICMMIIPCAAILLHGFRSVDPCLPVIPSVYGFGLSGLSLLIFYFISVRSIFLFEHRPEISSDATVVDEAAPSSPVSGSEEHGAGETTLGAAIGFFVALSTIIVLDGLWLAGICNEIARTMGWAESFVGAIFMALATSLPELMVSIGAVMVGSVDMAMGNILGSNLFNMFIIFICDFAYFDGDFLGVVKTSNVIAGLMAIIMSALVICGIVFKEKNGFSGRKIGWVSLGVLVFYFSGLYLLFRLGVVA